MPRAMSHSAALVEIDGDKFLAIVRTLTDAAGVQTRAKGGVWVNLSGDADAVKASLTDARKAALEFSALAEEALGILAKEAAKPAKAPAKIPTPPTQTKREELLAQLAALDAPVAPAPAPAKNPPTAQVVRDRAAAVAAAKATVAAIKPAPAKTPAPAKAQAAFDWAALIGQ